MEARNTREVRFPRLYAQLRRLLKKTPNNGRKVSFSQKGECRGIRPLPVLHLKTVALVLAIVPVLGFSTAFFDPGRAASQTRPVVPGNSQIASILIVGFMGGFVHANDIRHSEVQIAQRLQTTYGDRVQVQMFENRDGTKAHKWILQWLTKNGELSDERKRSTGIILFGHSWGASAAVYLARELQRDGITVSLTIQVDSVTRHRQDDSIIPANVIEAINFYQSGGILHGRSRITAADPSRTRILGNIHFKYQKEPPECRAYPWYDRLLFKGHTAIECDPRVWSQVDALIRMRLPDVLQPAQSVVATQVGP
jgi:pimeloyl-ACP methyl ester carboxylesterase